jgi:hypothetical protein
MDDVRTGHGDPRRTVVLRAEGEAPAVRRPGHWRGEHPVMVRGASSEPSGRMVWTAGRAVADAVR